MVDTTLNDTGNRPTNRWPRAILRWSIGVAVLCLLVFVLWEELGDFALLAHLRPSSIIVLLAVPLGSLWALGHTQSLILHVFGVRLRWLEFLGLQAMVRVGNMTAPSGGLLARAVYLRRVHGLPYSLAGSMVAGILVVCALVVAGLLAIGLVGMYCSEGLADIRLAILCLVMLVATGAMVLCPVRLATSENRWFLPVARFVNGWREIANDRSLVAKVAMYRLGLMLLASLAYASCLWDMDCKVGIFRVLTLVAMTNALSYLPISPGTIGIAEGIVILSARILGIDAGKAFALSVALRTARTAVVVLYLPLLLCVGNQRRGSTNSASGRPWQANNEHNTQVS